MLGRCVSNVECVRFSSVWGLLARPSSLLAVLSEEVCPCGYGVVPNSQATTRTLPIMDVLDHFKCSVTQLLTSNDTLCGQSDLRQAFGTHISGTGHCMQFTQSTTVL